MAAHSNAEEDAVQVLNDIKLAVDTTQKTILLKTLLEIVARREPSLIPTFLPEVVELQAEPSPAVRKALLEFIDSAVSSGPSVDAVTCALKCVSDLVRDTTAAIAKRAVTSAYPLVRASLALVVVHGTGSQDVEKLRSLWQHATNLKNTIVEIVRNENCNAGVRLGACKFIEQATMLLTAEMVPAVARILPSPQALPPTNGITSRAELVREAEGSVEALEGLLRTAAQPEKTGACSNGLLIVTCIRAVSTLLQQRPHFTGRLLPPLLALSHTLVEKVEKTPESTITPVLVSTLTTILESKHAMTAVWRSKLIAALSGLGIPSDQLPTSRGMKRARREEEDGDEPRPCAPPQEEMHGAASDVLRNAVASKDAAAIGQHVDAMTIDILADVVLHHLSSLPPRHLLPPDSMPHDAWLDDLFKRLWPANSVGVVRATPQTRVVPTEGEEERSGRPKREGPLPTPKVAPAAPVLTIPSDILAPSPLSEEFVALQCKNAALRVILTEKTSSAALQALLAARLAAATPTEGGLIDAMLEALLQDLQGRNGLEIFLSILYALFSDISSTEAVVESGGGDALERYESVLSTMLQGLKSKLPPSDRTMVTLLVEAPTLPMPMVSEFIASLCGESREWATLALVAARDIALLRPPSRAYVLPIVLEAAIAEDDDLRTKAIRLLANRMYHETCMQRDIGEFAKQQLDLLTAIEGSGDAATHACRDEETAGRYCGLYAALCTRNHSLLRHLFEAYGSASPEARAAIEANSSGLVKTIGSTSATILTIIQNPPRNSIDLALSMLTAAAETSVAPAPLVAACLQLYTTSKDSRVLLPVLTGMERTLATRMLSALLDLPTDLQRIAFTRLVQPRSETAGPLFSPSELLIALHSLENTEDSSIMRKVMAGIQTCINMPDTFPPESLAATINQLLTRAPLPQLLMRTIIQSIAAAPRLRSFVVGVLSQLASKQVWNDAVQWRGWMLAAQQTAPESFPTWVRLPTAVLKQSVTSISQNIRSQLAAYVHSPECQTTLSADVKQILVGQQ